MTTAAAAQLAITEELTETLKVLVEIEVEMVKLKQNYDEAIARHDELLMSLQNGVGAKPASRRRKTAGKDEATAEPEAPAMSEPPAEPDQSSTDQPETSPTVEAEPEKISSSVQAAKPANDELDRMGLGELSDLADHLNLQNTGKMTADMLRNAIRAHRKINQADPAVEDPLHGAKQFDAAMAGKKVKPEAKPKAPITPEQQKEYEKMDELYADGVEKATDGQKRMIFALLGTEHGIVSDVDKKAVIVGIIKEQHEGWVLESTKDLSKVWATGVIDYLKKHKTADLKKFYEHVEPFE